MDLLSLLATISFLFWNVPAALASLAPISIVGSKFYDPKGNQFFIKGIAYLPPTVKPIDVLSNTQQCTRDATLMHTLGVNTIRVYNVDPDLDHAGCMSAFDSVGIYVLVNLPTSLTSIRTSPPTWTSSQLESYSAAVDTFSNFTNTLGFFVGDETILDFRDTVAAPFIKAAVADLKVYRDSKGYRKIPIGYSSADVSILAPYLQNYLACETQSIDFFGQNNYQWCSSSSFTISGYNRLYTNASGYSIPMFFAETGCEGTSARIFDDQEAVLGMAMNDRWSGSIIYEWSDFGNGYGLVSYPSGATTGIPTPVPSNGFSNLLSRWSTLSPAGIPSAKAMATLTAPACPGFTAAGWQIQADAILPTLLQAVVTVQNYTTGSSSPTVVVVTQTTASKPTSSPSSPGSQQNSSAGISTGVKAGVSIGVVSVLIFASVAGFILWKRMRRMRHRGSNLGPGPSPSEVWQHPASPFKPGFHGNYAKSELPAATVVASFGRGKAHRKAELPTSYLNRHEMVAILTTCTSLTEARSTTTELSAAPFVAAVDTISLPQRPSPTLSTPAVPPSRAPASWSNMPWKIDAYPFQEVEVIVAQHVPLLSENSDDITKLNVKT